MSEGIGSNLHETMGANRESPAFGLKELAESLDLPLTPNEEFDLAYSTFQINYYDCSVEEMPEETESGGPYSDYRGMIDIFARCEPPTRLNRIKMDDRAAKVR